MLLFIVRLFSEPSLELERYESSSCLIFAPESYVMVLSSPPTLLEVVAMFPRRIPVKAISRLMSSAMSGEWERTLV